MSKRSNSTRGIQPIAAPPPPKKRARDAPSTPSFLALTEQLQREAAARMDALTLTMLATTCKNMLAQFGTQRSPTSSLLVAAASHNSAALFDELFSSFLPLSAGAMHPFELIKLLRLPEVARIAGEHGNLQILQHRALALDRVELARIGIFHAAKSGHLHVAESLVQSLMISEELDEEERWALGLHEGVAASGNVAAFKKALAHCGLNIADADERLLGALGAAVEAEQLPVVRLFNSSMFEDLDIHIKAAASGSLPLIKHVQSKGGFSSEESTRAALLVSLRAGSEDAASFFFSLGLLDLESDGLTFEAIKAALFSGKFSLFELVLREFGKDWSDFNPKVLAQLGIQYGCLDLLLALQAEGLLSWEKFRSIDASYFFVEEKGFNEANHERFTPVFEFLLSQMKQKPPPPLLPDALVHFFFIPNCPILRMCEEQGILLRNAEPENLIDILTNPLLQAPACRVAPFLRSGTIVPTSSTADELLQQLAWPHVELLLRMDVALSEAALLKFIKFSAEKSLSEARGWFRFLCAFPKVHQPLSAAVSKLRRSRKGLDAVARMIEEFIADS